jgi:hypothetical protein
MKKGKTKTESAISVQRQKRPMVEMRESRKDI